MKITPSSIGLYASLVLFILVSLAGTATAISPENTSAYYNWDTGSGSTLVDQSGNSNDGTINGMTWSTDYPTYATSGDGSPYSGSFDADGEYVSDNGVMGSLIGSGNTMTFSAWIYPTDSTNSRTIAALYPNVEEDKVFILRTEPDNTLSVYFRNYGAEYSNADITFDSWNHIVFEWDSVDQETTFYINGVHSGTRSMPSPNSYSGTGYIARIEASNNGFRGNIDDVAIWDRALSSSEIKEVYNQGIPPSGLINLRWKYPADLNSLNGFQSDINISYNYTEDGGNHTLHYNVTSDSLSCISIVNGTCEREIGTTYNKSPYSLKKFREIPGANAFYKIYADNELYPGTYNLPESTFTSQNPDQYTLSDSNDGVLMEFLNVSDSTEVEFLEMYADSESNATSNIEIYYCNASYDQTTKVTNTKNCALLQELNNNSEYEHCHNTNSCHYLIPIPSAKGRVKDVDITAKSAFAVIRTSGIGDWYMYSQPNVTREDAMRTTGNAGSTWSDYQGTFDAHIHQFTGSESFNFYSSFDSTDSGTLYNSTGENDTIDLAPIKPTSVEIYNPTSGQSVFQTLNINYSNATFFNDTNAYYNISLLNPDTSFNQTILGNHKLKTSYLWNVFQEGLDLGDYQLKVEAVDTTNDLSSVSRTENWTLETNAALNVTATEIVSGDTISNFTGWLYNQDVDNNLSFQADGDSAFLGIIRNDTYTLEVTKEGNYSTVQKEFTALDNATTTVNVDMYVWNSIYIHFKDADDLTTIDDREISLELISSQYSYNYTTNNGEVYAKVLEPETYNARYSADGYDERFYKFKVNEDSADNISLYLQNNTDPVTIAIFDETRNFLPGVVVKTQKYSTQKEQYITQAISETNSEGITVQELTLEDEYYKFFVTNQDGNTLPVIVGDETRASTSPSYIFSQSKSIQVKTGAVTSNYTEVYNGFRVDTFELNRDTNNTKVEYTDEYGIAQEVCLEMYTQSRAGRTRYSTKCQEGSNVGTILQEVTNPSQTSYYGKVVIKDSEGQEVFITDQTFDKDRFDFGKSGIVLQLVLTLIIIGFAGVSAPLAMILLPFSLIFGFMMGWHDLGVSTYVIITVVGIIVAYMVGNRFKA